MISVEVAYSSAPRQAELVPLSLPEGSRLADALRASGLVERHGLALGTLTCAVWGRRRPPEFVLRDGDRIELLRALRVDPKQARRERSRGQARKRQPRAVSKTPVSRA